MMSKVNFKTYQKSEKSDLPSMVDIVVAKYGLYLSVEQVAECIGAKYLSAYGRIRSGKIRSPRDNNHGPYKVSAIDLVKYMELNSTQTAS